MEGEDVEGCVALHVALVGGRAVDALRLVLVRRRALLRAVGVPLENRVVDLVRLRVRVRGLENVLKGKRVGLRLVLRPGLE